MIQYPVDLFIPLYSLAFAKYLLFEGYIKLPSQVSQIGFAGIVILFYGFAFFRRYGQKDLLVK